MTRNTLQNWRPVHFVGQCVLHSTALTIKGTDHGYTNCNRLLHGQFESHQCDLGSTGVQLEFGFVESGAVAPIGALPTIAEADPSRERTKIASKSASIAAVVRGAVLVDTSSAAIASTIADCVPLRIFISSRLLGFGQLGPDGLPVFRPQYCMTQAGFLGDRCAPLRWHLAAVDPGPQNTFADANLRGPERQAAVVLNESAEFLVSL